MSPLSIDNTFTIYNCGMSNVATSNCTELRHHIFKDFRRHKAFLIDTAAIVVSFSTYPDSFLKDCAIRESLKPLVTV